VCSGTPITGTAFVVTAAHCVLDPDGAVAGSRTVVREGVEYDAIAVFVDTAYHASPSPRLDGAVLVMDRVIGGSAAELGDSFPSEGVITIAGFQPLDSDGSLLRGTRSDNRPLPKGATGGLVRIADAPAGCVLPAAVARPTSRGVSIPCGLIPRASGGAVVAMRGGVAVLVGVISSVAKDLTSNGVVPLSALHELLAHPHSYLHLLTGASTPNTSTAHVIRS
jgi:hypothetical protein